MNLSKKHKGAKSATLLSPAGSDDYTQQAYEASAGRTFGRVDEPEAHPRPAGIGTFYIEKQKDAEKQVQLALWEQRGVVESTEARATHHATDVEYTAAKARYERARQVAAQARDTADNTAKMLTSFVTRSPHAMIKYWLFFALLFLGDIVGLAAAAVSFGAVPWMAVAQAAAASAAALITGVVGKDIAIARHARRRDLDLPDDDPRRQAYPTLVRGADAGEKIAKRMIYAAMAGGILVVVGVATLRTGAEDGLSGIVYGALAAAICIGSLLSTYHATDEVADMIDNDRHAAEKAEKQFDKLSRNKVFQVHDGAVSTEKSILDAASAGGQAAAHTVDALKQLELANNPAIAGYGETAETTAASAVSSTVTPAVTATPAAAAPAVPATVTSQAVAPTTFQAVTIPQPAILPTTTAATINGTANGVGTVNGHGPVDGSAS